MVVASRSLASLTPTRRVESMLSILAHLAADDVITLKLETIRHQRQMDMLATFALVRPIDALHSSGEGAMLALRTLIGGQHVTHRAVATIFHPTS